MSPVQLLDVVEIEAASVTTARGAFESLTAVWRVGRRGALTLRVAHEPADRMRVTLETRPCDERVFAQAITTNSNELLTWMRSRRTTNEPWSCVGHCRSNDMLGAHDTDGSDRAREWTIEAHTQGGLLRLELIERPAPLPLVLFTNIPTLVGLRGGSYALERLDITREA